ncbi:uncharacterized protein LAJ45_01465 [Morchella importuna]|uniref:uncharacterized protein n=1 Tax=Morchella importuna TaxID=1174673 RepID=UPI001E8D191C|nr:uncharacterized protein LAJ45_01465 [Morchella importuna]KAH8154933.1 hypothetical protein LAJ45_01465 [Morchella importuna]
MTTSGSLRNQFISSTAHAVSAAEAISNILEYDPDLSFIPYFFGIYLLQGSFLLLLIADKLQGEASGAVVTACETIVRAHEVCVVTLNTEYQRNFRKVHAKRIKSGARQRRTRGYGGAEAEEAGGATALQMVRRWNRTRALKAEMDSTTLLFTDDYYHWTNKDKKEAEENDNDIN